MKAVLINPWQDRHQPYTAELVDVGSKLEDVQALVGGLIELMPLEQNRPLVDAYVNEEGLLGKMAPNPCATFLVQHCNQGLVRGLAPCGIVGPMVILGCRGRDWCDVPDQFLGYFFFQFLPAANEQISRSISSGDFAPLEKWMASRERELREETTEIHGG